MLTLSNPSKDGNKVTLCGKVMSASFVDRIAPNTKSPAISVKMVLRINQDVNGVNETEEVEVDSYVTQFTSQGKPNDAAWSSVQRMKALKTAETYGIDEASTITINSARLQDSSYVSRNTGKPVVRWSINNSFFSLARPESQQSATFKVDAYIMRINPEFDRDGAETGRVIVHAGVVPYANKLDEFDFIAEDANVANLIAENWKVGETRPIIGRVRSTVREVESTNEEESYSSDSFGESFKAGASPKTFRELVITGGRITPYPEENSYDPAEMKIAIQQRKASMEQTKATAAPKAAPSPSQSWRNSGSFGITDADY